MKKGRKPKLPMGITEEFISEMSMLDLQGKKTMIARLEAQKHDATNFKKTNEAITSLKDNLAELVGPINDTIKASRNRQKFLVEQLKEAGEFQS